MADEGRDAWAWFRGAQPKKAESKWTLSLPIVVSLASLSISLTTAAFSYQQLNMARDAQLTPYRSTFYKAKLDSYQAIRKATLGGPNAFGFNVAGWVAEFAPDSACSEGGGTLVCHYDKDIEFLMIDDDLLKEARRGAERADALIQELDTQSVVWSGRSLRAIQRVRRFAFLQSACLGIFDSVATAYAKQPAVLEQLYGSGCERAQRWREVGDQVYGNMYELLRLDLQADQIGSIKAPS